MEEDNTMQQTGNEAISALLDGESDDLELRRLLNALESDADNAEQLLSQWQRYHLAQDVLHGRGVPVSKTLAANIAQQLEQEETYSGQSSPAVTRNSSGWQHALTRIAIAASVAAVFVVGLQTNLAPSAPATNLADVNNNAEDVSSPLQPAPTMVADSGEQFTVDPVAEERLRLFLEGISVDVSEPVVTEQIQDSPLFRLVNSVQD